MSCDVVYGNFTIVDQERLEPHSDTTLSRGLNPVAAEDEYIKGRVDTKEKRLTMTPTQDQESLEPHIDTTLARGLNPVEAEEFVLDNVEAPKAKEEDENMPNQIASLVEKMLKEQFHLKEIGTERIHRDIGEGVSLSIWDFAGQDIYYTTHQVFLTWRAIYVIVFDLSRSLDSVVPPESRDEYYEMAKGGAKSELTCLEFINFWLCSIFAHAVAPSPVLNKNLSKTAQKSPPIFIVGTHRESVKGDAKEKKEKIRSAFEKIRNSIKKKPFECHVVPKYYAIENTLVDTDEDVGTDAEDGIVSDAWTTLEEDGILEDRLIQHVWQGFLEQKVALVKLMTKFDLICEAPVERLQQGQQSGLDDEVKVELNVAHTPTF
eukprot:XP_011664087.1 PREDICTED: uncharacterized protein LOC105438229 [Strongylocentrotus purpuratus]